MVCHWLVALNNFLENDPGFKALFLHHQLATPISTMNSVTWNQWPGVGPEGKINMPGCADHYYIITRPIKMLGVIMASVGGCWPGLSLQGLWSALITSAEWRMQRRERHNAGVMMQHRRSTPTQTSSAGDWIQSGQWPMICVCQLNIWLRLDDDMNDTHRATNHSSIQCPASRVYSVLWCYGYSNLVIKSLYK